MKFIRFTSVNNKSRSGILKNESEVVEITGDMFGSFEETGNIYPLNGIKFLPPSVPSKIICVGLNYSDHAEEMNKPLPPSPMLFMKPNTAVIAHN